MAIPGKTSMRHLRPEPLYRGVSVLLTALIVFSLLAAAIAQAPSARAAGLIYVSTTGDDASGNGTVAAPYLTINKGLSVAVFGDTVLVEAGQYPEQITLKSGVTLLGAGESATVIDGGFNGTVVTANGVSGATLDGFGVTGGSSPAGGAGILVSGSTDVSIQNSSVFDNVSEGAGPQSSGAGVKVIGSSVTIRNTTIQGNSAEYSGAGIYISLDSQASSIRNSTIQGNMAGVSGGGVFASISATASLDVSNNQMLSNFSSDAGAGIHFEGAGSGRIVANTIQSCEVSAAADGGAAIFIQGDAAKSLALLVADNLIYENYALGDTATGAGVLVSYGVGPQSAIVNNTISGNYATQAGGLAVYSSDSVNLPGSDPIISNNIIWGNQPDDLSGVSNQDGALGLTASVVTNYTLAGSGNYDGVGNIVADPGFVSNSDFRLADGSPAIDAGSSADAAALASDLDGKPRIMGVSVDIGAYEKLAGVLHIITASAGEGGIIEPSGTVLVEHSGTQEFNITPNPGYQTTNVFVDGVSVGALGTYAFSGVTGNHSISATYAAVTTYTVVASPGAHGSIAPSGTMYVQSGDSLTFIITPDPGYHISSIIVDGIDVGPTNTHTFNDISEGHSLSSIFAPNMYNVVAAAGPNGSVTPSGILSLAHGSSQDFVISPNLGYQILDVLLDGTSIGPVSSYNLSDIQADHVLEARFGVIGHSITATAGVGGSISPSGNISVNHGANQAFVITPNPGYNTVDVMIDGASIGAVSSYTFNNVTASHTISANFNNTRVILATAGVGGMISPSGTLNVAEGATQIFSIQPETGYTVADVLVDGVSAGPVTSYVFNGVRQSHTILATFTVRTFSISASSGQGGSITPAGSQTVSYNGSKSFAINANAGYHIVDVLVDGVSAGSIASYTFSNVAGDHTIAATFAINTYVISSQAGPNGSITPAGNVTLNHGASQTYAIRADDGYRIDVVVVDGMLVGRVESYRFNGISASHSIRAFFTSAPIPAEVTLGALSQTYDGSPKAATASTIPAGLSVAITYDGFSQAPTNAGSYAVAAIITDPGYTGGAGGVLVIAKANANVVLTASANPSVSGHSVTFTAMVSASAGVPAGAVQFRVDGAALGAPVDLVNGVAVSTATLAAGVHTVAATYSGDNNFNTATSNTLTQQVVGARWLKQQTIALLTPYEDESRRIETAIEEIEDSLEADLWIDETHVDLQHGQQVFDNERHAVQELTQLLEKNDASPAALIAAQQAIDALVEADRLIATTLIADAGSATVKTADRQDQVDEELERAAEAMAEGDASRDEQEYDNAIDAFRNAWDHAGQALSHASYSNPGVAKASGADSGSKGKSARQSDNRKSTGEDND